MTSGRLLRAAIAEAVAHGHDIDESVGAALDGKRVSDELADALWLYAWALVEARETGTMVTASPALFPPDTR